jgi:hypothetical protein
MRLQDGSARADGNGQDDERWKNEP